MIALFPHALNVPPDVELDVLLVGKTGTGAPLVMPALAPGADCDTWRVLIGFDYEPIDEHEDWTWLGWVYAAQVVAHIEELPRHCRVCGCHDLDCSECFDVTGEPCEWVEADLCSRCADAEHDLEFGGIAWPLFGLVTPAGDPSVEPSAGDVGAS